MNTDFVHPKDAPKLQAAAQQDFLKADAALQVRLFENVVISPLEQSGNIDLDNAPILIGDNGCVVPPPANLCE